jgi:hypothetical protein
VPPDEEVDNLRGTGEQGRTCRQEQDLTDWKSRSPGHFAGDERCCPHVTGSA